MDFAMHYTEEQEKFRQEVQSWIKKNVPANMKPPGNPEDRTHEYFVFWREKHKELGAKGWLNPTAPKQYGGGGLTAEHEAILQEEYSKAGVPSQFTVANIHAVLYIYGTEEQKQKFLKPMLSGQINSWERYTEAQSGSDLANVQATAVKDGDEWVLNATNQFVSGVERPEILYGLAKTDPDAPRHRNLGFFMVPFPYPGVEVVDHKMINPATEHFIYLRDVRVPAEYLIGGDHQGWQVGNTTGEVRARSGQVSLRDDVTDAMVEWIQEHKKAGRELGSDPVVLQEAVEAWCDIHNLDLMRKRIYEMHMGGQDISWEGACTHLYSRHAALRNDGRIRHIYGPYAQLGSHDPRVPHGGLQDAHQRQGFGRMHAGGSQNIARVVLARRIGISRTKERAPAMPTGVHISL